MQKREELNRFRRWSVYGTPVLFFLVLLLLNWSYFHGYFAPDSDIAANAIRIDNAGDFKELLGPYSRFGYYHIGPIAFYYLAMMEKLFFFFPVESGVLNLAQFILNCFFIFWTVHLVFRLSGSVKKTLLFFLFMLLSVFMFRRDLIFSIWGPDTLIYPFFLMILSVVSVWRGNAVHLFPFVVSTVFLVHQHLGTMVLVVPFYFLLLFVLILRRDRKDIKPVVYGSLLLLGLNFAPILEQFTSAQGNLTKIFNFFLSSQFSAQTPGGALIYIARYFGDAAGGVTGWAAVGVMGVLVALAWILRSKNRFENGLLHVSSLVLFLAFWGAWGIKGEAHHYLMIYLTVLPFCFYFLLTMALFRFFKRRRWGVLITPVLFIVIGMGMAMTQFRLYGRPANVCDEIISSMDLDPNQAYEIFLRMGSVDHDQWGLAIAMGLKFLRRNVPFSMLPEWEIIASKRYIRPSEKWLKRISFRNYGSPIKKLWYQHESGQVEWGDFLPVSWPYRLNLDADESHFDNLTLLVGNGRFFERSTAGFRLPGLQDASKVSSFALNVHVKKQLKGNLHLVLTWNDQPLGKWRIDENDEHSISVNLPSGSVQEDCDNYLGVEILDAEERPVSIEDGSKPLMFKGLSIAPASSGS